MKYKMTGSLEIRIPEGHDLTVNADSPEQAVENMLEMLVENGSLIEMLVTDYLKIKKIRQVFKITVTETHTHTVEIDTDDYEDIEDEYDAMKYVENNIEEFTDDFDYDYYSRDNIETDCTENYDVEEDC